MRKIKRKLKLNSRVIAVLAIFLSVGFAYISSAINIDGLFTIFKSTYDVHFENLHVIDGSVEAETPTYNTDDTEVSVSVRFNNPGDFYEFTIDAVNAGDIDAMLNTVADIELTEDQEKYIDYTVTYEDGEELAQYQELNSGDTCTFKVKASFKEDIEKEDLPVNGDSIDITLDTEYIRADDNRIKRRAENSLYNVLKKEANSGDLAKKYTGEHQDSIDTTLSTKDIYYWYGRNPEFGTEIQNKNNVIFANHCWQMIRTTDTGGVKLLYNGETENNQCLDTRETHIGYSKAINQALNNTYYYGTSYNYDKTNKNFSLSGNVTTGEIMVGEYTCKATTANSTCKEIYYVNKLNTGTNYNVIPINSNSHYSQFGALQFNEKKDSPAYVGYMYNKTYSIQKKSLAYSETMSQRSSLNTNYWYADSVTWNSSTERYILNNPFQVSSTSEYSNLTGKYTLNSSSPTEDSCFLYYITLASETDSYSITLTGGNTISDINYTYTYGDSYTDNGNGTYTINNPRTIKRIEWNQNYSNVEKDNYICKEAVNNTCSDLMYITSVYKTAMNYTKKSETNKYANDVIFDGSKYILDNDTSISFFEFNNNNTANLNNAHYTCFNSSGECESVSYIYYLGGTTTYYITLNNGKIISDAIEEMLYEDGVNAVNSMIKTGIDKWYEKYLIDYSDYLDDTIFCNERSQINANTNGWNPNSGNMNTKMYFEGYNETDKIKCSNVTDQFSISNDKAKLKYKIGLIQASEMKILANANDVNNQNNYWQSAPYSFDEESAREFSRFNVNTASFADVSSTPRGVRPAISLKPGSFYTTGNGSKETPYIVYTE